MLAVHSNRIRQNQSKLKGTIPAECSNFDGPENTPAVTRFPFIPYPTAFPYGNCMVLHFYQQQESSTNKTAHKVINKGLKAYV